MMPPHLSELLQPFTPSRTHGSKNQLLLDPGQMAEVMELFCLWLFDFGTARLFTKERLDHFKTLLFSPAFRPG